MIGRVASFALLLVAAATPASADPRSEALVRDFVSWVDSSPDWDASAGVVRSEGSDTIVEGLVFTRLDPRVSVSIEALRLTNLSAREAGGFTASKLEMTSGGVLTETVNATIPSASALDVTMPSFAGVSFDPRHMMTAVARFYSIAAAGGFGEVRVPEVTLAQRQDIPGTAETVNSRIVYRNLRMFDLSRGVIERQEIGPISVSGGTSSGDNFQLEIEKLEARRLDLGACAHVLNPTQYRDGRGDGIWRPIVASAAYRGFKGSGADGVTFTLDEVAIENIDGRQTDEPFAEAWDRLLDPAAAPDAKDDLALEAFTSMVAAWRVGNVRLSGLAVDAPKEGAMFALNSMTLTGWSNDGFDSFILKAMTGSAPGGYLSLESLELAGFVAPDLKALVNFAAIEKDLPLQAHAAAIGETFAALPRFTHFGLQTLVAGKSEADAVSLESFTLNLTDWNKIFAGSTDISLTNLNIPRRLLELDPQTTQILETLGYDDLVFAMSLSDRWAPEAGTDDATWKFALRDAADVEFSYQLTGLTIDWLMKATAAAAKGEDGKAALMAMLSDLRLSRATLSVTDRSLLDRAFQVVAEKQGLKVDGAAYREQMRAALPFIVSAAVPTELAKLVIGPLQSFMAGGQRLFADITPPTPLGLLELMAAAGDPMGLPARLHLSLRSETP